MCIYVFVCVCIYIYIIHIYYIIYRHTQTHNGILVIKKSEILPFAATWIDLENMLLSEVSQTEKDKCYMMSLTCGI